MGKRALAIVDPFIRVKEQYDNAKVFIIDTTDTPYFGNNELGIEFVTYEDFACGACHYLSKELRNLSKYYNMKIRICYKYFH